MQRDDVARILEYLTGAYNKAVDPSMAHAWYESLKQYPAEAGMAAAQDLVHRPEQKFMPNVNEMVQATQVHAREARRAVVTGACQACGDNKGWVESRSEPGHWLPCETCNPEVHHTWATQYAPQLRAQRAGRVTPDTRFETPPAEHVRELREVLADEF